MAKQINSFVSKLLKENPENIEDVNKEENNSKLNDNEETIPSLIQKTTQKGDKHSAFVQNTVVSYQNSEFNKNEKVTLNINRGINNKLKMLGFASEISVTELSNAILYEYLERHKKEIAVLMKKIQM